MADKLDQNPKSTGTWLNWKDHSNNQVEGGGDVSYGADGNRGMDKSLFEYSDSTEQNIHKKQVFPDNGFQENPKKD